MPSPVARTEPSGRQLHGELRAFILTAQARPGAALSETIVAERFGISRTPVREVFQRLADEGLLRIVPQVGTFVAPISLEAVYDSQFVRETLECRAVALAARNATDRSVRQLRDHLSAQAKRIARRDHVGFFASDEAMHRTIMEIAGHPGVWQLIASAKVQLDRLRYLSLESADWLTMIFDQHRDIVALIAAKDHRRVAKAMRTHLRTAFAAIERIAHENQDFFEGVRSPPPAARRKARGSNKQ